MTSHSPTFHLPDPPYEKTSPGDPPDAQEADALRPPGPSGQRGPGRRRCGAGAGAVADAGATGHAAAPGTELPMEKLGDFKKLKNRSRGDILMGNGDGEREREIYII